MRRSISHPLVILWLCAVCGGCATDSTQDRNGRQLFAEPTGEDRALAARVDAAIEKAEGTPGQEAMQFMARDWPGTSLALLRGDRKATTTQELAYARGVVANLGGQVIAGLTWPKPERISIPRARTSPRMDGVLDEPDWRTAMALDGVFKLNDSRSLRAPATTWRVMWDESNLYFSVVCDDSDILAPDIERDDKVFLHDCVELFLCPDIEDGRYWEIVVGPGGSVFDALHQKKPNGWGPLPGGPARDCSGMHVGCRVNGTRNRSEDRDQGYAIEVAVPFSELPLFAERKPAVGDTLNLMLMRVDKSPDAFHVYSFQPLLSWGHNLWNHTPARLEN